MYLTGRCSLWHLTKKQFPCVDSTSDQLATTLLREILEVSGFMNSQETELFVRCVLTTVPWHEAVRSARYTAMITSASAHQACVHL